MLLNSRGDYHLFVVEGAGCVRGPAAGMGVKLLRDEAARIPHPRQLLPVPLPPLAARSRSVTDVRLAAAVQRQIAGSDSKHGVQSLLPRFDHL